MADRRRGPTAETPELRRLRRRIDVLDRRIVALLNERARLAREAGRAKTDAGRTAVRDAEREREILLSQVPGLPAKLAGQLVHMIGRLRDLELKKAPSIAESVDWARTLIALEVDDLDAEAVTRTLGVVLKHASDHDRAIRELKLAQNQSNQSGQRV